jgi:PAS domain S-box-containing protein
MQIDIFSAVIFNVTSSFFIGLSLFFVARGHLGEIQGIKRWASGLFFQCFGWTLLGVTKIFPELIPFAPIATTMLILSLAFYYLALIEFKGLSLNTKWVYYAVLIDFGGLLYFDVVNINVGLRVVITAFFSFVFVTAMSHLLLSKRFNLGEKIPASHKMMGCIFATCSAVLLARIIYFSVFSVQDIFANNMMQTVSYLMFHIVISFTAFGFLLMCSEKYVKLQRETENRLKNSEARYKKIIEILPVPMALYDNNQRIRLVNKVFTQTFGYDLSDISNLNEWWQKAYPDEQYRAWVCKEWAEALKNIVGSYSTVNISHEVIVRCKNGSDKTVLGSASTLTTDVDGLYLAVLFDITARKNQELEMHKAQLAAEALAESKAEFLANMSHEIRTPMNAIIGFTELALDDNLNDDVRNFLEKIHISSKSLLQILNDILDFSKAEAGKLEIVPSAFNLKKLLDDLHNLFSLSADNKRLNLLFDMDALIPISLIGDALRVQQILANLIGNAIKFTTSGNVKLELSLLETENTRIKIRFKISDTGIGISKDAQEKLFQPFMQADSSTTRRFGGTGLGLSISQKLLQLMNSEFHLDSQLGKGSVFYFDLWFESDKNLLSSSKKLQNENAGTETLSTKLNRFGEKLKDVKILLAEDDVINQEVVSRFLKLSGVDLDTANDGFEVLEKLKKREYDLILMDVNMPNLDGIETTKQIREQAKYQTLPIVALTAGVTLDEQANCRKCGMNDFVKKPINPEELVGVLCRYIDVKNF